MGMMAIHAVVSCPRPFRKIPVSRHATMGSVQIVRHLLAMTLGTQLHDVPVPDRVAVGQFERFVIRFVVAGKTGDVSVGDQNRLVKIGQIAAGTVAVVGIPGGMAHGTTDGHRRAVSIDNAAFDCWNGWTGIDCDRMFPRRFIAAFL